VKYHTVTQEVWGCVAISTEESTEEDVPLQEYWMFSRFLTCRMSKRAGAEGTRVNTGHNV
jgi:hypothetical protein